MAYFLLVLLGLGIGALGTLIGAGGGFILVPILLFVYPDMKPETVTSISLAIVFMNAASGTIAYARMKRIDYKSFIVFALAALPEAILGAYTTSKLPKGVFTIILAILLVIISIYLFINPGKKIHRNSRSGGKTHRSFTDSHGEHYDYSFSLWKGILISIFVGFLSSLLGIGGGIIHVPALISILNFPVHIATATSHSMLAVTAFAGTIVHIVRGDFNGQWLTTLSIGLGVIIGAQFGARLSNKLKPHWIVRALAAALLIVGVRLLFNG